MDWKQRRSVFPSTAISRPPPRVGNTLIQEIKQRLKASGFKPAKTSAKPPKNAIAVVSILLPPVGHAMRLFTCRDSRYELQIRR